jgi:hypothetical protein
LPPKQRSDYQVEVGGEIRLASHGRARRSAHYKQATSGQRAQVPTGEVPQPPPHFVSHHSRADRLAYHEADTRRLAAVALDQQVPRDQRPSGPAAALNGRGEVGTPPHPSGRRKHGATTALTRQRQTLTRARPFRRRAARIARPALVRIRRRNPWVFARWRLFG